MKAVIEKLLFGVVIMMSVVSPALAGGAAQAHYHYQYRHHHYYNYSEALPRYESCNCWFGYDGNGPGKCTPVTACSSEGGRCRASCPPQKDLEWYVGLGSTTSVAPAVNAEVAKKCEALRLQNYPPREPGNPAAGSASGDAWAQKSYFDQCIANGGNEPSRGGSKSRPKAAPK